MCKTIQTVIVASCLVYKAVALKAASIGATSLKTAVVAAIEVLTLITVT